MDTILNLYTQYVNERLYSSLLPSDFLPQAYEDQDDVLDKYFVNLTERHIQHLSQGKNKNKIKCTT